jgi:hypothetical protein
MADLDDQLGRRGRRWGAEAAAGAAAVAFGASSFLPQAASNTAAEATTDKVNLFMGKVPVKENEVPKIIRD